MGVRAVPPIRGIRGNRAAGLGRRGADPSGLVRVYAASTRARSRVIGAGNAVFDGFWLGLLDPVRLAQADEHHVTRARVELGGELRPSTDPAVITDGLRPWEEAAVRATVSPGDRVVVPWAGSGREVLWLLEHGFDAVGYDPNLTLVDAGRRLLAERGHPDRLHGCGRHGYPEDATPCELVFVGCGAFGRIPGRHRRVQFLNGARRGLAIGGAVVISYGKRLNDAHLPRVTAHIANAVGRCHGRERVEVGDALAGTFVHRFTPDEVRGQLAAADFLPERLTPHPYPHAIGRAI